MVVKISKNLEMKSLLPTPRSCTSFSPTFPLLSLCTSRPRKYFPSGRPSLSSDPHPCSKTSEVCFGNVSLARPPWTTSPECLWNETCAVLRSRCWSRMPPFAEHSVRSSALPPVPFQTAPSHAHCNHCHPEEILPNSPAHYFNDPFPVVRVY
jgi:hypothetical protein